MGVYIWGKQYYSYGNGPIAGPVSFAASQGFHTVRLAMSPRSSMDYGLSGSCDSGLTLTQMAQESQFEQAFANPDISTFILTTYDHTTFGDCSTLKFLNPSFYTTANTAAVEQEYKDLTMYLYQTYHGTGKTFILSNWEGDNQLYCDNAYGYATNAAAKASCDQNYATYYDGNQNVGVSIQGMKDWLEARSAGIAAGRAAAAAQGLSGVSVYSAAELNIVRALHDNGYASMLYDVLPGLPLDYVLYSSYESINNANPGQTLAQDIATIENVAGTRNVIIGEFGYNQLQVPSSTADTYLQQIVSTVQNAGLPYAVAWQLFDQPAGEGDFGLYGLNGQPELVNGITQGYNGSGAGNNIMAQTP